MRPTASETSLIHAALIWLRSRGVFCWRHNVMAATYGGLGQRRRFVRSSAPGSPDIHGVYRGRAIFLECKRGRNQPTAHQTRFLAEAQAQGALTAVVWNLDDLEAAWRRWNLD